MLSSDPKVIMNELEEFYKDLYEIKNDPPDELFNIFLQNPKIPKLSPDRAPTCEGKLTVNECYESLNSFKENKSPGNDGLTLEFYKTFWELIGELLVESLNYAFEYGELSNSQSKQL